MIIIIIIITKPSSCRPSQTTSNEFGSWQHRTPQRCWLHALPLSTCGLRLDNEAVRVAVGVRLGTSLCEPHQCPCGKQVDARGTYGLSCKRGAGRSIRHHQLNDIIHRTLTKASTHPFWNHQDWKTTGWADPHYMATRKEPHMGCHCHRHRQRLIPSSNIGEGWWRCRERRHQEGGKVR